MANKPLKGVQFPGLEDTYINPIQPGTGANATIQNDIVNNKATGEHSHAEGKNTQANGLRAHSEGVNTIAKGDNAHVEGLNGTAYANQSHVEGVSQKNVNAVASTLLADLDKIKNSSLASAQKSAQIYEKTKAAWDALATANKFSIATGAGAHVEGGNGIAHGAQSHVEGLNNVAKGDRTHVEGQNNIALMTDQHVQGRYNVADTTSAHIVGWGSASQPKNIHTLSTSGDAWFAGDVKSGSGKLATESYVDNKMVNAGTNSDWSENDENSSSYVKNRTHWLQSEQVGRLIANQSSDYWDFFNLSEIKTVRVFVDGIQYDTEVTFYYHEDFQTNIYEIKAGTLYIHVDGGGNEWYGAEGYNSTFEIYELVKGEYHKLDKNYLPDENIYHNELAENESLPNGVTLLPQMPRIFFGTIDPTNETFGNDGDIYIMYKV